MSIAISSEALSKNYRIGELHGAYGTLRDTLAGAARRIRQRDHGRHYEEIWALRDVSFEVAEGRVLGVIGRNGAGKSTLLKILTRITTPTSGRATIRGRVGSLLEVGTGFHPELTGRENVYLNGAVLGMKRREITKKFSEIVEFAGVDQFIDTPVKRYSSGMSVRLAFAVAAHLEAEVLLVDEVLAVGDAEFQRVASDEWRTSAAPAVPCSSSHIRCRPCRSFAMRLFGSTKGRSSSRVRVRKSLPAIYRLASGWGRQSSGPRSRRRPRTAPLGPRACRTTKSLLQWMSDCRSESRSASRFFAMGV